VGEAEGGARGIALKLCSKREISNCGGVGNIRIQGKEGENGKIRGKVAECEVKVFQ